MTKMNGEELEKHLNKISDYVEVDDKIVTYKWISQMLQVHTNTAKQLLYAFSKKVETTGKYLTTYVVAGEPKDGEGLLITIVLDKRLEEFKAKLKTISFVHVYSVQKGTAVCGADIYNAEVEGEKQLKDCENADSFCAIRPNKAIVKRDVKAIKLTEPATKTAAQEQASKVVVPKSTEPLKTKDVPPNKKNEKEKVVANPSKKTTSPIKNDKKPAKEGGIGALFMKQSATKKKPELVETKENVVEKHPSPSAHTNKEPRTPVNDSKSTRQPKKKRKKPKDSKESEPKRKRIRVASESGSSNEESDADERYPSPEPEVEASIVVDESADEDIVPATPVVKGRKRVKKMIVRTFTDEEGYIITKKESVLESCSEDEVDRISNKREDGEELQEKVKPDSPKKEVASKTVIEPVSSKVRKPKVETKTKGGSKPSSSKSKSKSVNSPKKQSSIKSFFKTK